MDTSDKQLDAPEPASLRHLRQLVTVLTVTLTLGMVIIVGLMVSRFGFSRTVEVLPESLELPAGETLTGFSRNADWMVLITMDEADAQRVHLIPDGSQTISQTVEIKSAPNDE